MELVDRLKEFIANSKNNIYGMLQNNSKNEIIDGEYKQVENEKEEKEKIKTKELIKALEEIKEKLNNKELSPFKRMTLQLKLDLIETKLDKQLEQLRAKQIREKVEKIKDKNYEIFNKNSEKQKIEYDRILDAKFAVEREIEVLLGNKREIQEREERYNRLNNEESSKDDTKMYQFRISPGTIAGLEEKQAKLEEIQKALHEKEEEILNARSKFNDNQQGIDQVVDNHLKKYNPISLKLQEIKNFFKKATNTVKEFFTTTKAEREAKKKATQYAVDVTRKNVNEQKNTETEKKYATFKKELAVDLSENKEDYQKYEHENEEKENPEKNESEQDKKEQEEVIDVDYKEKIHNANLKGKAKLGVYFHGREIDRIKAEMDNSKDPEKIEEYKKIIEEHQNAINDLSSKLTDLTPENKEEKQDDELER